VPVFCASRSAAAGARSGQSAWVAHVDARAHRIADWLAARDDCSCESGLDDAELQTAERRFDLVMPPLWRAVLAIVHPTALPVRPRDSDGVLRWSAFPDWRLRDEEGTRRLVDAPVEGLLFDVEHGGFWWNEWGTPADGTQERLRDAQARLADVPRLTPLWGHLYVGSDDSSPVFSIVQADLYVPHLTLSDLVMGRGEAELPVESYPIGTVPFWSRLHAYSQIGHFTEFGALAQGGL
jgi:hypothetical protein